MPKKTPVEKINSKKFRFENQIFSNPKQYSSSITVPNSIGKEHAGKRVRVTLEILE